MRAIPRPVLAAAYGLVFVPVFGITIGLAAGPRAGVSFGVVGLVAGIVAGFLGPSGPSDVGAYSRFATETWRQKYGRGTGFGLALWLASGLAGAIAFGPATGVGIWAAALPVGAIGGVTTVRLSMWADLRATSMPVADPLAVLRLSRTFSLWAGLVWGLVA